MGTNFFMRMIVLAYKKQILVSYFILTVTSMVGVGPPVCDVRLLLQMDQGKPGLVEPARHLLPRVPHCDVVALTLFFDSLVLLDH